MMMVMMNPDNHQHISLAARTAAVVSCHSPGRHRPRGEELMVGQPYRRDHLIVQAGVGGRPSASRMVYYMYIIMSGDK